MLLKSRSRKPLPAALVLLIMAILPLVVQKSYFFHVLIIANIYVIFTVSWDLLSGYTGQLNLGHAAFFGAGAYTAAFLDKYSGISPWLSLILGGIVAVGIGLLVGIPCLRLKGPYLTIVNLAMAMILFLLATTMTQYTNGEEGISGLKPLVVGTIPNYYLSLALMAVSVGIMYWMVKSDLGLVFQAIREDSRTAEAVGVNLTKYKLVAYISSAFFAGLAGSFQGHYLGIVTPDTLSSALTFSAITMATIGGIGTMIGPIIGVYALNFLFELLHSWIDYRVLFYSILLVLILLFLPEGLYGFVQKYAQKSVQKFHGNGKLAQGGNVNALGSEKS